MTPTRPPTNPRPNPIDDADRDRRAVARAWIGALLASLLLWNLPYGAGLLYPFKLLSTWTHELAHAVMMTITGARFLRLEIFPDTSGQAFAAAGIDGFGGMVIAGAGYMGVPVAGALVLVLARTARRARMLLALLALVLTASAALCIANRFGQISMAAIAVPVAAIAALAPPRWVLAAAQVLAAQACINAVLDIRVLMRPTQIVGGMPLVRSDAHEMADLTFGTTATWAVWIWAAIWLAWALALLYLALRATRPRQ